MKRRLLIDASFLAYWRHFVQEKSPSSRDACGWLRDFVFAAKPDETLVCFDGDGNWRRKLHNDYKQHRAPRPDGVNAQLKKMHRDWKSHCVDGFEADDIIATLATERVDDNSPASSFAYDQTLIVANDKDFHQLLDSSTLMHNPQTNVTWDTEAVFAKWGCGPGDMRVLQAICGDAADGIPGVPGFGPKRAALIANELPWKFVLEAINEHDVETLSQSGVSTTMCELLIQFGDRAKLNYELVGLRTDVPL